MDPLYVKIITLGVLIALTLLLGVLPYFLVLRGSRSLISTRKQEKVIAYLNCFAGGVFLGTLLLHLLTEGSEVFEEYKSSINLHVEIPLFNIFVAVGFFLVAFLELFMRSWLFNEAPDTKLEIDVPNPASSGNNSQGQYGSLGRRSGQDQGENRIEHEHNCTQHEQQCLLASDRHHRVTSQTASGDVVENGVNQNEESVTLQVKVISDSKTKTPTGIRAYLLLVALSFHTIFDGLAVGLQKNTSEVWQVFAAISIHKSIIAFCLGLEMFKSEPQRPSRAFIWLCFFALMSPIGIGIGIFLTSGEVDDHARMLSSSILQGLAAGIFLYVTFLELLCVYIGHNSHGEFFSIFFSLVGFVVMALVKLIDE
ncbi:zinc transporter ZIP1 [Biomphalaria glabrata]|uniref:Zinc transporter ZIP1-like n=1 Tax=Biomphalaria glabrata TaxID=6526 RepID=A0A9W2YH62_BIOGL|nr:zinc transporter ZIP1-like [Biomphalaria glabrata]XP_055862056.1 zinc transporter ZIP1-like [Biomphalaria glabrata]XP_055862057.1 zinc transporter ZIP1-like [Biomphalaria glabrata]XP_055862058.1 zinc transporter ZIP1-like [Biomphalaria glabrata]XP_055862059.1 zinc transporter ZIP1-like [Biomphalaria glabrata]XP_055862060.1 zinc transporter ZIP1-like [Biomphalaria glabrata]XP_055862061.1 zinc transporter ZIP1-like [Biomphalaria glabrata]XP_055862062.1 zinc transporter ZIP1-like [Biomphalar